MIVFTGDWHGCLGDGIDRVRRYVEEFGATVIQVGDFGWWPDAALGEFPFPVYWIDGNHEYFGDPTRLSAAYSNACEGWLTTTPLLGITEITEVYPNVFYIPRGTVAEFDGKTLGFLGGADSIDRHLRTEGVSWFREEAVRQEDVERLVQNAAGKELDLLVTHTPPRSVIWLMGFKDSKERGSAALVQQAWERLDRPKLICGHMHRRADLPYLHKGVTVLPEFGVYPID